MQSVYTPLYLHHLSLKNIKHPTISNSLQTWIIIATTTTCTGTTLFHNYMYITFLLLFQWPTQGSYSLPMPITLSTVDNMDVDERLCQLEMCKPYHLHKSSVISFQGVFDSFLKLSWLLDPRDACTNSACNRAIIYLGTLSHKARRYKIWIHTTRVPTLLLCVYTSLSQKYFPALYIAWLGIYIPVF